VSSATQSLVGKRIVVTRAAAQAIDLLKALQYAGAVPILLPVIQILPAEDISPLDEALRKLSEFDGILFTSQNAVRIVHERLEVLRLYPSEVPSLLVGAVGQATATEAMQAGFIVAYVASRPLGVSLVEELGGRLEEKRVLLPRSDRANPDVLAALEKAGALATDVVAYRTISGDGQNTDAISKAMNADAVLFFSPSAAEGFDSVCGAGKLEEFARKGIVLASGPVTLSALHARGIASACAAPEPSVARIVEALAHSFKARKQRV
jgi:uroporphyrinogen-III synthase